MNIVEGYGVHSFARFDIQEWGEIVIDLWFAIEKNVSCGEFGYVDFSHLS